MNLFLQFFKKIKRRIRIWKKARHILQDGIYSVRENRIVRVEKLSMVSFPLYFNFSNNDGESQPAKNKELLFYSGGDKDVFVLDKNAISFFMVKGQYDRAKLNYKNIDRFIYPCCEYYEFDDDLLSIQMQKINGVEYSDDYHQKIVYRNLFTYALNSEFEIASDGKPKYIQHMDVRNCNIIWDDNSMIFIDLDGIAPASILFDILQYSFDLGKTFNEVLDIIKDNNDIYVKVLKKYNFYLDDCNPLDTILFDFVEYYNSINSIHWKALNFLICDEIYKYPKTKTILKDMGLLKDK